MLKFIHNAIRGFLRRRLIQKGLATYKPYGQNTGGWHGVYTYQGEVIGFRDMQYKVHTNWKE